MLPRNLVIVVLACAVTSGASQSALAQGSCCWSALGAGVVAYPGWGFGVEALAVFDDGTGAALYAGGYFTSAGGIAASGIARWDGIGWSALGLGVSYPPTVDTEWVKALAVFDAGNGPALHVGGRALTTAGSTPASNIASWSCGSTIAVSATQGAPGAPIFINNTNLTPGNEYYNISSLDLCPGGAGTGPYLGLCATTLPNVQFILLQAGLPPETPPFHFTAHASYLNWGPFLVGPVTLDALCFDFTGGVLGPVSPVARITIQ